LGVVLSDVCQVSWNRLGTNLPIRPRFSHTIYVRARSPTYLRGAEKTPVHTFSSTLNQYQHNPVTISHHPSTVSTWPKIVHLPTPTTPAPSPHRRPHPLRHRRPLRPPLSRPSPRSIHAILTTLRLPTTTATTKLRGLSSARLVVLKMRLCGLRRCQSRRRASLRVGITVNGYSIVSGVGRPARATTTLRRIS
jgi:hypothetical protein